MKVTTSSSKRNTKPRRALINYRAQNERQVVTNTVVPNGGLRARLGCPVVAVSGPQETLGSGRQASGSSLSARRRYGNLRQSQRGPKPLGCQYLGLSWSDLL